MAYHSSHIPFPVASAALRAGRLAWLLEHARQISMDRDFEIAVCELIATQDSEHLLPGSAEFLRRVGSRSARRSPGR